MMKRSEGKNEKPVRWLVAMMMMMMVVGALGCVTTAGIPSAKEMPAGKSFSGLWYSEQFQHMYLYQEGDQLRGVYAYGGGGTLEGEVTGNLLLFSWEDPGSREAVRRTMRGQGYLQLVEEEGKVRVIGEWGYNQERRGAGPWTAEFIRELEEDDPRTLEELRRVH